MIKSYSESIFSGKELAKNMNMVLVKSYIVNIDCKSFFETSEYLKNRFNDLLG